MVNRKDASVSVHSSVFCPGRDATAAPSGPAARCRRFRTKTPSDRPSDRGKPAVFHVSPFKIHCSIAFKHQPTTGSPSGLEKWFQRWRGLGFGGPRGKGTCVSKGPKPLIQLLQLLKNSSREVQLRCTGEPETLSSRLLVNSSLRSRSTRQDADLSLPRVRTEAGRRRLLFGTVQQYNGLPPEVSEEHVAGAF